MPLPDDCLFYGLSNTMTEEQRYFVNSIIDYDVTICDANAGTGKTTMAVATSLFLTETFHKRYHKAYYIFAPVNERVMGYRKGDQDEKDEAYYLQLKDAIIKLGYQPENLEKGKKERFWIEPRSHTFQRGANLENAIVIVDEAQNFTRDQMKKVLSRVHDSARLVVIGHQGQIDLKNKKDSGFQRVIDVYSPHKDRVRMCQLTKNFRGWISTKADEI